MHRTVLLVPWCTPRRDGSSAGQGGMITAWPPTPSRCLPSSLPRSVMLRSALGTFGLCALLLLGNATMARMANGASANEWQRR